MNGSYAAEAVGGLGWKYFYTRANSELFAPSARSRQPMIIFLLGATITRNLPMTSFAEFEAAASGQGADEVLERKYAPNVVIDTHTPTASR